jgi:hypothetical protein
MTKPLAFGFLCFCVTLAVLIGQRLSDQAMAVIVGSVIGVVASMPMAALMLWMLIRQRELGTFSGASARRDYAANEEAPRMIVIQPQPYTPAPSQFPMINESSQLYTTGWDDPTRVVGGGDSRRAHGSAGGGEPAASWRQMRPARDFTIVGEEEFEDENRNALVR